MFTHPILICAEEKTDREGLRSLIASLERAGCKPVIWRGYRDTPPPCTLRPILSLIPADRAQSSKKSRAATVERLRRCFAGPVLAVCRTGAASHAEPYAAQMCDAILPSEDDAHFFELLYLWTRIAKAETLVHELNYAKRRGRAFLDALFARLPYGVIIARNPSGSIAYQNAAASRLWWQVEPKVDTPAQYVSFGALSSCGAPMQAEEYPLVRSLQNGERVLNAQMLSPCAADAYKAVRVHSLPIHGADGAVQAAMCLFTDSKASTAASTHAARATALGEPAISNAPAYVVIVDPAGCLLFSSAPCIAWMQAPWTELQGKALGSLPLFSHETPLLDGYKHALNGIDTHLEHRLRCPTGETVPFLVSWLPLRETINQQTRIVGAAGYFVAAEPAPNSKPGLQHLPATLLQLPIKMFQVDAQDNVTYLSDAFIDYLHGADDCYHRTFWRLLHPDDYVTPHAKLKAFAGGDPQHYRLRRHDGAWRWHKLTCLPLLASDSDVDMCDWVGLLTDVHEVWEQQQALTLQLKRVQAQHDEAMRAAREAQAQIALLQRERDNREHFVATLSHDLRTPLTVAQLGLERLLRATGDDDKLSRIATRAHRGVARADAMIASFLDISRLEAGKPFVYELVHQSMRSIIELTLEELEPAWAQRCRFDASIEAMGAWDASGIRRILENLIGNALKYGAEDTLVTIRLSQTADETIVQVHNAGSPIAADDQKRLFAHFDRLPNAVLSGQKGWGIGLTLVAGLTHAYGGRVQLESAHAVGTIFSICLPQQVPMVPTSSPHTASS